jgi:hypothetical protein
VKTAIDKLREMRKQASDSLPRLQRDVADAERALNEKLALLKEAQALASEADEAVTVLDEIERTKPVTPKPEVVP